MTATVYICIYYGQLEQLLIKATHSHLVELRIDHLNKAVQFGNDEKECDQMRSKMALFARKLQNISNFINPQTKSDFKDVKERVYYSVCLWILTCAGLYSYLTQSP